MKTKKEIKLAIVSSQFWGEIAENLTKSCLETLKENGIGENQVALYQVPGSLEIPLMVQTLAKKHAFDAIITFGVILKGETYHFEHIANECIRGCMDVSLRFEIPVIYEVLAVFDIQDAIDRSVRGKDSGHGSDKGAEAAMAALKMIDSLQLA